MTHVGVVVIAAVASGGDGTDVGEPVAGEQETGQEADQEEPTTTGIGDPARDGQFEFNVQGLECGAATVGEDPVAKEAQGQFCILNVTMESIGDQSQPLLASDQYLYDDEGREFSADDVATFTYNPQGDSFFTEINPGNSIEGAIVFDVPQDANIVSVELHDSAFSDGVEVEVSG